jgi:Flp pilus assembly protein TadG
MSLPGTFSSRLKGPHMKGPHMKGLRTRMRKDARRGSAAVEFAMIAPVFFLFLFGIIETGVIYFAQASLTNAIDDAARQVRTGQKMGTLDAITVKGMVCNGFASSDPDNPPPGGPTTGLMSWQDCLNNLQVDMRVFENDGSLDVNNMTIQATDACKVVLFRAYYPWKVLTPFLAPLMSNMPSGNEVLLGSAAAFRTEPYPDTSKTATTLC